MHGVLGRRPPSPWHGGEIALQERAGVAERMAEVGPLVVRDRLVPQHRDFYPQLPFVVLGAVDPGGDAGNTSDNSGDTPGDVWATLIAGRPGFVSAVDETRLRVAAAPAADDPAAAGLAEGAKVGLLGIELTTRRRNRLNGTVRAAPGVGSDVEVEESFGNCPKYIQLREPRFVREPDQPPAAAAVRLDALDERARALILRSDAFFVASYVDRPDGRRQVDVSHRGGRPGFVRIDPDGALTIPDFSGNRFFNTLGNIVANPRAGLLFVDFETGDLLQLSGGAEVLLDDPEIEAFDGAERLLRVFPRRIVWRPDASPLRFATDPHGRSPFLQPTGSWEEAGRRLAG